MSEFAIPAPDAYIFEHESRLASSFLEEYAYNLMVAINHGHVTIEDLAMATWSACAVAQAEGTEHPTAKDAASLVNDKIAELKDQNDIHFPITLDAPILDAASRIGFSRLVPGPNKHASKPRETSTLVMIDQIRRRELQFSRGHHSPVVS